MLDSFSSRFLALPRVFFFLAVIVALIFSCSQSEEKITAVKLFQMAKESEPSLEMVKSSIKDQPLSCEKYGEGCVPGSVTRVRLRLVTMLVVQFETAQQAKKEAERLGEYSYKNWVFDEVRGEPVLEHFFAKTFESRQAK